MASNNPNFTEERSLQPAKEQDVINLNESVKVEDLHRNDSVCLASMHLPHKDIFASIPERKNVFFNFPAIVNAMDPDIRKSSYYLSKFLQQQPLGCLMRP